jgi:hypothetical protein
MEASDDPDPSALEHSFFMTLGAIFKTVRLLPWPDKMILPLEPTTI